MAAHGMLKRPIIIHLFQVYSGCTQTALRFLQLLIHYCFYDGACTFTFSLLILISVLKQHCKNVFMFLCVSLLLSLKDDPSRVLEIMPLLSQECIRTDD